MVRSGLRVLDAMLEEDRPALYGPRYAHQPARAASRAGTVPGEVVLGGRKVAVQRPRVRADGREVPASLHEYPLRVGRRGPHFSGPSAVATLRE